MNPIISNIRFIFDVESIGLHGEHFAAAYVVYVGDKIAEMNVYACPREAAKGSDEDRKWVDENCPGVWTTHATPTAVCNAFWHDWMRWKELGAQMFAECAWPVEARFLARCINQNVKERNWNGPYPLHEIASFMAAAGMDPMASYPYKEGETKHHPLSDAKQSARLLNEALKRLTS